MRLRADEAYRSIPWTMNHNLVMCLNMITVITATAIVGGADMVTVTCLVIKPVQKDLITSVNGMNWCFSPVLMYWVNVNYY